MANEDKIYDLLVGQGFTPAGAAGAVGNLQGESGSGIDPNAVGDNGTSHGIAQWHNDRWTKLVAAAQRAGRPANDLEFQTAYFIYDMASYGILDKVKNAQVPSDAVSVLVSQYEKPSDIPGNIATRSALANSVLKKDAPGVWDRIKGLPGQALSDGKSLLGAVPNPLDIPGEIQGAIGDAFSAAGDAVVHAVEPIAVKISFVGLGLALIAGGAYIAVARPLNKKATSAIGLG